MMLLAHADLRVRSIAVGLGVSYHYDLPTGPVIIVLCRGGLFGGDRRQPAWEGIRGNTVEIGASHSLLLS